MNNHYNNNQNRNFQKDIVQPFSFDTKNMSFVYNCSYYDEMIKSKQESYNDKDIEKKQSSISRAVVNFRFEEHNNKTNEIKDLFSFILKTSNPGLLIGSGNFGFGAEENESFKLGFSFDYVTGLPYIPGSSIKGAIRSHFPEQEKDIEKINFIKQMLNKENINVINLVNIFDNEIVFLDAFPLMPDDKKLLAEDYITPHKDIRKNPVPIKFIKVKTGVKFKFEFIIKNEIEGLTKQEIINLFENIIILMGLGAKTSVGYGRFEK